MTEDHEANEPSQDTVERPVIPYAAGTPAGTRRIWVYALLGIYLLLVVSVLTVPFWIAFAGDRSIGAAVASAGTVALLAICGLALLLTPVRITRRRPMTRQWILIPILASGLLLGGLVAGAGLALAQLFAPATQNPYYSDSSTSASPSGYYPDHSPRDSTLLVVAVAAVAVWIAWSVIFGLIAGKSDSTGVGMNLHRILIAGSVLELLVAVPAHIIVRRRGDCCGGFLTGTGICIGIAIALVSFGPTVLLLY